MDIGNVIVMSATSLTMCFKAFRHPAYQIANSFINSKEGMAVDPLLARAGWNLAIDSCF
jgi:hypothetical protein|tara:strand:+ start:795 stop:971 length:177 start_codon:yes stop_codon:yes gene_type:complete